MEAGWTEPPTPNNHKYRHHKRERDRDIFFMISTFVPLLNQYHIIYVRNPGQFDTVTGTYDTIELVLLNLKLENLAFFSSSKSSIRVV